MGEASVAKKNQEPVWICEPGRSIVLFQVGESIYVTEGGKIIAEVEFENPRKVFVGVSEEREDEGCGDGEEAGSKVTLCACVREEGNLL